jgi:hypothetical protein
MWEMRHEYTVLVGRAERKKPLGKPRHRWGNKSKMYLQGRMGRHGLD